VLHVAQIVNHSAMEDIRDCSPLLYNSNGFKPAGAFLLRRARAKGSGKPARKSR
jgi:hypothetical protein